MGEFDSKDSKELLRDQRVQEAIDRRNQPLIDKVTEDAMIQVYWAEREQLRKRAILTTEQMERYNWLCDKLKDCI